MGRISRSLLAASRYLAGPSSAHLFAAASTCATKVPTYLACRLSASSAMQGQLGGTHHAHLSFADARILRRAPPEPRPKVSSCDVPWGLFSTTQLHCAGLCLFNSLSLEQFIVGELSSLLKRLAPLFPKLPRAYLPPSPRTVSFQASTTVCLRLILAPNAPLLPRVALPYGEIDFALNRNTLKHLTTSSKKHQEKCRPVRTPIDQPCRCQRLK